MTTPGLITDTADFKLFMILLGSKAPGRVVEQHDYFFGIARQLKDLVPQMKAFWPEAGSSLHIDGWREVTCVEGYRVSVVTKTEAPSSSGNRLFFINLGGYRQGKLEEQHYNLLTVQDSRISALQASKKTQFFREATIPKIKGAGAHIDEKYGIDVDDIYRIEEVLSEQQKAAYHIVLQPNAADHEDSINLGYFILNKL